MSNQAADDAITIANVRLTHPDRILFPDQGTSKRDLACYYQRACTRMLPYLDKRPLTLVRCPEGRDGDCFYQKHANASVPSSIGRVEIVERSGETREYMLVDSLQGLIATAQIGALELHIWGARSDRLDRPERVVFDLDPDESLPFARIRDAAFELRDILASVDLRSFPLLTGGKGVHVIVPIRRTRSWDEIRRFARGLAGQLSESAPERYIDTASRAARSGRIYIDWQRNQRGATAIAPWSVRAKAGAPVATPIGWNELTRCAGADIYSLENIDRRLSLEKTWPDYFTVKQSVTREHLKFTNKD